MIRVNSAIEQEERIRADSIERTQNGANITRVLRRDYCRADSQSISDHQAESIFDEPPPECLADFLYQPATPSHVRKQAAPPGVTREIKSRPKSLVRTSGE